MRLRAEALGLRLGGRKLFDGLAITLDPGQCWALLGRNGSGKTTLLHTLAGIRTADKGRVELAGRAIADWPTRQRARALGLLPQESHEGFAETVLDAALAGRHPHIGRWQAESAEDHAIARQALQQCGLMGFETRPPETLSGGERRRLALATVLTQQTPFLLLDEPLNHLDINWQWRLMQTFSQLVSEGRGLMMSLHDPNLALRFCTHALVLDGQGGWQAGEVYKIVQAETMGLIYGIPMKDVNDGKGRWIMPDAGDGTHLSSKEANRCG